MLQVDKFSRPSLAVLVLVGMMSWAPDAPAYTLADGITGDDYNKAGVAINDAHHKLSLFMKQDGKGIKFAFHHDFASFRFPERRTAIKKLHGLKVERWDGALQEVKGFDNVIAWFQAWRSRYRTCKKWVFKLVEIESIADDHTVVAATRFEALGTLPGGQQITERGRFRATFKKDHDHHRLLSLELLEAEGTMGPGNLFVESSKKRGIDFYGKPDPRFVPPSKELKFQTARHSIGGSSTADVDGDGYDDVLLSSGENLRLYMNRGDGTFQEASAEAGLGHIKHSNAHLFSDFDNDGDKDLIIVRFFDGTLLFANNQGKFTDVTAKSGLGADLSTAVLAAADVNGDGKLDLYMGRYLNIRTDVPHMIHYSRNGEPNTLYLGNGDLTFSDVTEKSGTGDIGLALGIATGDYDRDGDQDIYIANDFGRNVLYRNNGDGTFKDVAKETGTLAISGGMAASFGDYNNDGNLDIYVSSIQSNQRWFSQDLNVRDYIVNIVQSGRRERLQATFLDLREHLGTDWDNVGQHELAGNYLLKNNGDGTFEDISNASGARQFGWYWGSGFVDINNDGLLDIYAVNGWITGKKKHDL